MVIDGETSDVGTPHARSRLAGWDYSRVIAIADTVACVLWKDSRLDDEARYLGCSRIGGTVDNTVEDLGRHLSRP